MRIALDFDDVLSRFLEATIAKLNFVHDLDIELEDIKGWNMDEYIDCTKEQLFATWTPKFIESVPFRDGARKLVDDLKALGHEVVIATACFAPTHEFREKICMDYLGLISEDVIFIKKKYLLNVDVLVDDKLDNFMDSDSLPCEFEKVVYNMPHNQNSSKLGLHYRVNDLSEIVGVVETIQKNRCK